MISQINVSATSFTTSRDDRGAICFGYNTFDALVASTYSLGLRHLL
jgi:hypothetical protein